MTDSDKPDHFDSFESDHPRAMTKFDGFGSSSKMAAAKPTTAPIDPFAHIPRIPRAPLSPGAYERANRDTDRVIGIPQEEEQTPAARPFEIRVEKQLEDLTLAVGEMKRHCQAAAENSFAAAELVRGLRLEMQELKKENDDRFRRLELDRFWFPRIVSTAALIVSLLTAGYVLATHH